MRILIYIGMILVGVAVAMINEGVKNMVLDHWIQDSQWSNGVGGDWLHGCEVLRPPALDRSTSIEVAKYMKELKKITILNLITMSYSNGIVKIRIFFCKNPNYIKTLEPNSKLIFSTFEESSYPIRLKNP